MKRRLSRDRISKSTPKKHLDQMEKNINKIVYEALKYD
jgi:hypothetical protein